MELTRDQISQLSQDELDAYARAVLEESRSRRAKLSKARGYRGRQIIPLVVIVLSILGSWFGSRVGWEALVLILGSVALMQWHAAGLNRRIDALANLLELDSLNVDRESGLAAPLMGETPAEQGAADRP